MTDHSDFRPGPLPDGERILWHGGPSLTVLATRVFHINGLAVYLGILAGWAAISASMHGAPMADVMRTGARCGGLAFAALVLVSLYCWLVARNTRYTITTRRVVMRVGVALPVTINIPFAETRGAALKPFSDGSGHIALDVGVASQRISYMLLWPCVRPWRMSRPSPVLLAVKDAAQVSQTLKRAVSAVCETREEMPVRAQSGVLATPLPA